jgi:hypothetical protein
MLLGTGDWSLQFREQGDYVGPVRERCSSVSSLLHLLFIVHANVGSLEQRT